MLGDLHIYRTLWPTLDLFASEFSESVDDERLRLTPWKDSTAIWYAFETVPVNQPGSCVGMEDNNSACTKMYVRWLEDANAI